MADLYTLKEFYSELDSAEKEFLSEVVKSGDKIRGKLGKILTKEGLQGEVLVTGSTNPSRLTCVIDPKAEDERYTPDFDVHIITKDELDEERIRKILRSVSRIGSKPVHIHDRVERACCFHGLGFPATICVLSENEAQNGLPDIYTKNFELSENEKKEVRILKLFLMRNGLYGDFTYGIGGFAAEQLIRKYSSFVDFLKDAYSIIQTDKGRLEVIDPVDKKNLLNSVQEGVLKRLFSASKIYNEEGELKSTPYEEQDWVDDHSGCEAFKTSTDCCEVVCGRRPFTIYKGTRKIVKDEVSEIGKKQRCDGKSENFVMPYWHKTSIFIAISGLGGYSDVKESIVRKIKKYQSTYGKC